MSVFRCFGNLCAKTKTDESGSKPQICPDVSRASLAAGAGETEPRATRVSRANDDVASTSQPSATNSQAPKREPSVEHPSTPLTENFEEGSIQSASELSQIDVHVADEDFDHIDGRRLRSEAPPSQGDRASTSGQQAHRRTGHSSRSPDGRPTPTNPVTFLQAVIDDVQNWQAQVAAIHSASSNSQENKMEKKMDDDRLKDEIMKTSISTLQRRNEELLGELDRLSSRLHRAEKEIARMQGRLDEYVLKENNESGRSSDCNQHSQGTEGLERRIEGSNHQDSRMNNGEEELSQENRNPGDTETPNSEIGNGDQLNSSIAHDGIEIHEGVSPSGISKEDYFITENKCLKMWIAKMQASISHMETEVFAMRQEKSDLLGLLSQYSGLNKWNKHWPQPMPTLSEVAPQPPPPANPSAKPAKPRAPGMSPALNRLASRNARQSSRNARLRNVKSGGGGAVSGSMKREKGPDFDSLGSASNYVSVDKDQDFDESIYKITPTWKP